MAKTLFQQIRTDENQRALMRETCTNGGWVHVSDMVRDLVSREAQRQSQQPQHQNAQSRPDPQPDAPPL